MNLPDQACAAPDPRAVATKHARTDHENQRQASKDGEKDADAISRRSQAHHCSDGGYQVEEKASQPCQAREAPNISRSALLETSISAVSPSPRLQERE